MVGSGAAGTFRRTATRWVAWSLVSGLVLGVIVVAASTLWFGSLAAARGRLDGCLVYVEHASPHGSSVQVGRHAGVQCRVRNLTFGSLTIIGAETLCRDCAKVRDLPMILAPHEERELIVDISAHGRRVDERIEERVRLFTEPAGTPTVFSVTVEVGSARPDP